MDHKIRSVREAESLLGIWRASASCRVVATNGCFDVLHVGHVEYLRAAAALGSLLVVGINSDAGVKALKGPGRPMNTERDRAALVASLDFVAMVVVFDGTRATGFLRAVAPEVYVKGGDYTGETLNPEERSALRAGKSEIRFIPLSKDEGGVVYSSSRMIRKYRLARRSGC